MVDVAVAGEHELEPDAEAVERWVFRADESDAGNRRTKAAELVVVLGRLQCDVVAEPLRLLVGVDMAADVDEQSGVVHRCALLLVQPDALRQSESDQALPQDVLHRLTEAQIDAERERGDELREADLRAPLRRFLHR